MNTEIKYLELLSKTFKNIAETSTEIINLQAIMNLPKGTEHFMTDIHGEYEAFNHVLRNGSGTINALVASDIALAGVECIVPFDEVVQAMYEVGNALPETLRETALGGCAACPSAKKWNVKYFQID